MSGRSIKQYLRRVFFETHRRIFVFVFDVNRLTRCVETYIRRGMLASNVWEESSFGKFLMQRKSLDTVKCLYKKALSKEFVNIDFERYLILKEAFFVSRIKAKFCSKTIFEIFMIES